ncbi:Methyltransferase domain-containing protein [Raineyella antarctica]|uniref:Methyltransferase domain-containing protein n=1 Tax=Raineyella antarctica TaxID=1577474 RepID=A0A1G6GYH6_9ACTN|nr:class I SAM-dependent methyltransferase [Raineyella antarctica]SDB87082.1 Methyltransferase domain-containing protein [Raineyella antarctica]
MDDLDSTDDQASVQDSDTVQDSDSVPEQASVQDPYEVTAGAYDLFNADDRAAQQAALRTVVDRFRPEARPVLEVGAGSGRNFATMLNHHPQLTVFALEPSAPMRALALGRVADHPEWFDRITVWPQAYTEARLPDRIGGAVMFGVLGHFDAAQRSALLADLARRLPVGGVVLLDLKPPARPQDVEPYEFTVARIGALTYRCRTEGQVIDHERMLWRITYRTLDGDRVLVDDTTEHEYRHLCPEALRAEAAAAGLRPEQLGDSTYWTLTKD